MGNEFDYTEFEFEFSPIQENFLSISTCFRKGDASASMCAKWILKYILRYLAYCCVGHTGKPGCSVGVVPEPGYHPTTYLFKAQALIDGLCLVTYLLKAISRGCREKTHC